MDQVTMRIFVDENGRCIVWDRLAVPAGDHRVRMLVDSLSPEPNVVFDPDDPWDKWPDHIFID